MRREASQVNKVGMPPFFPTLGPLGLAGAVCFHWVDLEQEETAAGDRPVPGLQTQPLVTFSQFFNSPEAGRDEQ